MEIKNSNIDDLDLIFELYRNATAFMKAKGQVHWPEFAESMIIDEINDNKQWKLLIEGRIACVWATTLNDELIWGEQTAPSVYLHRIAAHPEYRGKRLVNQVVDWAENYGRMHDLEFIRMDTVGLNKALISHYEKMGFEWLGTKELLDTDRLPAHYSQGPVCLFQKKVNPSYQ